MGNFISKFIKKQGLNKPLKFLSEKAVPALGLFSGLGLLGKGLDMANLAKGASEWYPGKYLTEGGAKLFGQEYTGANNPLAKMSVGNILGTGGNLENSLLGKVFSKGQGIADAIGQNIFGLEEGKGRGAGFGLGLNTFANMMQMTGGYDKDMLNLYNRQLKPLQDSIAAQTKLAEGYMDPNSAVNQHVRNSLRGTELEQTKNLLERAVAESTGTYGNEVQGNINMNTMSDILSSGLLSHSQNIANQFDKGANIMTGIGNLSNALAQGRMQNLMYAQQQQREPWQFLSDTGFGLMQKGLFSGMQGGGIDWDNLSDNDIANIKTKLGL